MNEEIPPIHAFRVCTYLDLETFRKVREVARRRNTTISALVRECIWIGLEIIEKVEKIRKDLINEIVSGGGTMKN